MDEIVAALAAEQDELRSLVATMDAEGPSLPSACAGWTVSDVFLHLAQTNELAVGSVGGTMFEVAAGLAGAMDPSDSVDQWADQVVAGQRGDDPWAPVQRWGLSATKQVQAFDGCDLHARVTWVAGDMAARTLATTRLTETWIHHTDIAHAFGRTPEPTDRLRHIARLSWRTLPYAFIRAGRELTGPVAFDLVAPDGSAWAFGLDDDPMTVVTGPATDLCRVAGQRADAADTALAAEGPDADLVLSLVRTFA